MDKISKVVFVLECLEDSYCDSLFWVRWVVAGCYGYFSFSIGVCGSSGDWATFLADFYFLFKKSFRTS